MNSPQPFAKKKEGAGSIVEKVSVEKLLGYFEPVKTNFYSKDLDAEYPQVEKGYLKEKLRVRKDI